GYDAVLQADPSNHAIRQRVQEKMTTLLPSGRLFDFGAGTGLDLGWMVPRYEVIFCEPAVAMRRKAIRYNEETLHSDKVFFLSGSNTDFNTWDTTPPFPQKADALLSNFGPVNNIPDINLLFSRLALVLEPGGHCLLTLLDLGFRKRLQWHRRNALLSLFPGRPFVLYLREGAHRQTVWLHSAGAVRKAAAPHFDYISQEKLGGFGFTLFHFIRK
ncbi:MAG: class I SAM-dependent methyltransferase, partial [Bacteroidetes bacterium]|nr:class I SAM-dependent methyltransferase [Bacteroidota bacterium]